jgi:hypothetical protein
VTRARWTTRAGVLMVRAYQLLLAPFTGGACLSSDLL